MADVPTRDWFIHVDSVCSLVANRRYGLEDDELAAQLKAISWDARGFAETVGDRYVGGFPITLETMVEFARTGGQLDKLRELVGEREET
jgi:hypothetical protein